MRPDPGVEVDRAALQAPSLPTQPREKRPPVPVTTRGGRGREVVDVQVPAPGEVVPETEARDRHHCVVLDHPGEPVALVTLHLVDLSDERRFVGQVRPQLPHRDVRTSGLGGQQLEDHPAIMAGTRHTGAVPRESLDLVPDERGIRAVQAIWDRLHDAGLPTQADHRGRSNQVHLTLAESAHVADPAAAAAVVCPMLPLHLPVAGLVVLGSGRMAVALLLTAPPELATTVSRLRADVGQAERPWVPHVTLARQVPREQVGAVVVAVGAHGLTALRFVQLRHWQPVPAQVTTLA